MVMYVVVRALHVCDYACMYSCSAFVACLLLPFDSVQLLIVLYSYTCEVHLPRVSTLCCVVSENVSYTSTLHIWFCLHVYLCAALVKCLSVLYALLSMLIVMSSGVVKHEYLF